METVLDYFLAELLADIEERPSYYVGKYPTPVQIVQVVKNFYDLSGYENLADIEDMTDKQRRKWMRGYLE